MLTIERFLRANDDWEERPEKYKTSPQWKSAYKRSHSKARVNAQANDDSVKFGAENYAARLENITPTLYNQL